MILGGRRCGGAGSAHHWLIVRSLDAKLLVAANYIPRPKTPSVQLLHEMICAYQRGKSASCARLGFLEHPVRKTNARYR
jgi:hypothetical protein